MELVAKRKDGSLFPAELSHSRWQEKDAIFHSIILRDISKRKRLEDSNAQEFGRFIQSQSSFFGFEYNAQRQHGGSETVEEIILKKSERQADK